MTDLETAIMIKNMARETVKRMTAKVKNAGQFKRGDKVTVDGKYDGVVQAEKDGYYEVRIFDGSRVVGDKVCWAKDLQMRK